jgi:hypothetical protein
MRRMKSSLDVDSREISSSRAISSSSAVRPQALSASAVHSGGRLLGAQARGPASRGRPPAAPDRAPWLAGPLLSQPAALPSESDQDFGGAVGWPGSSSQHLAHRPVGSLFVVGLLFA